MKEKNKEDWLLQFFADSLLGYVVVVIIAGVFFALYKGVTVMSGEGWLLLVWINIGIFGFILLSIISNFIGRLVKYVIKANRR